MPLIERREGQERTYQDTQSLSRAAWARILDVTDYAAKVAIQKSGSRTQVVEIRGTPMHVTPIQNFPEIVAAVTRLKNAVNGRFTVDLGADSFSPLRVETPLGSTLIFQRS